MANLIRKIGVFNLFLFAAIIIIIAIIYNNYYSYTMPKTIWMYWDSTVLPKNVELIKQYNEPAFREWNLIYLNPTTLYEYIDKGHFPVGYHELLVQHKADWIRLYVLRKYGGVWIDASIIFNDKNSLNKIWAQTIKQQSVFTAFYGNVFMKDQFFTHISGKKLPLLIDNWFIMAPKNSYIIQLWFDEYTQAIREGLFNYKQRAIQEGVDIHAIHFKNAEDVYLTQHICIEKIFQKTLKTLPSHILISSDTSMLRIQNKCKWKHECVVNTILHDPQTRKLPYVKLTRHERDDVTAYFKH